jgi:two-component system response regulator HydG
MWLADRFVRLRDDTWLDLATNAPVVAVTRVLAAGEPAGWLTRCARVAGLWHSHVVPLVDYVALDDGRGLELYEQHEVLRESPRGAHAIADAVARFLRTHGLNAGPLDGITWAACAGRPSVVLPAEAGCEVMAADVESWQPRAVRARAVRTIGLRLVAPDALGAILAILDEPGSIERTVLVHAAPRAGATTLLRLVARESRLRGFCPLSPCAALRGRAVLEGLRDRRVTLLSDTDVPAATIARALAALWLHHVEVAAAIRVTVDAWRDSRAISLTSWSAATLAAAVYASPPRCSGDRLRLALRADGSPGRLIARWLEGAGPRDTRRRSIGVPLARPSDGDWGAAAGSVASFAADRESRAGPVGPEYLAAIAPPWHALRAGRAREALGLFSTAIGGGGTSFHRGRGDSPREPNCGSSLGLVWRGLGLAALDDARLDVAALALKRALSLTELLCPHDVIDGEYDPAGRIRWTIERDSSSLAVARCHLWHGRAGDAARLLSGMESGTLSGPLVVRLARYQARTAWRCGAVLDAWRALGRAAPQAVDPEQRAAVACDRARLALACGDVEGCDAALAVAARDARERRRGLLVAAIRIARLTRGFEPGTRDAIDRLAAPLARRDVPWLIRLRVQYALERTGRPRTPEVDAFAERWGVEPLENGGWGTPAEGRKDTSMVKDLQAVLEICRDSVDALPALGEVCAVVRDRLGASVVSVYGAPVEGGRLAQAGAPRFDSPELARRTFDSGVVLQPTPVADGIEAAAPVVYAGQRIGAITCRWTIDAPIDAREAHTLLLGAATALAPHVQGLNDVAVKRSRRAPDTLGLLGASAAIVELRERIRRVSSAPFHVLIEGESGSGKELVARALHLSGPRAARRFCAVNCAALTDDLFEAELFGHARGAFTGAVGERAGLFEDADGGTLFLDEVGELSLRAQAKLLRAIQDGEIRRVGESLPRRVDARIVAATNRTLAAEAEAGRFRADLLYRLDVIRITVPPLRDRPEDIAMIARASWTEAAARIGSRATLHADTLVALARYHWPGNVRELQNVIRALAVNAPPRGVVGPARLPHAIAVAGGLATAQTLDAARRSFEERFVRAALARAGDRPGRAARDLGLTRQGLRKLLRRLGIADRRGFAAGGDEARGPAC